MSFEVNHHIRTKTAYHIVVNNPLFITSYYSLQKKIIFLVFNEHLAGVYTRRQ